MVRRIIPVLVMLLLVVPLCALADWDPSIPAKWVQLPDETLYGIDVSASYHLILADDFECVEPGAITQFHIWGSWFYDVLPMGRADSVNFVLSIHADIPASQSPTGYSMPGDILWYRTFRPGEFTAHVWLDGVEEGWMDPPDGYIYPADYTIWQYNFYVPPDEVFYQQGTPDDPIVYWLDVKAIPFDGEARFGWKSSVNHWNDGGRGDPGPDAYYPGDDYVDVLGVDVYLEYGHNFDQYVHDTLLEVGGGRPIAFTENGEMPNIPALSGSQPNWVYWSTWWGFEGADSGNSDTLYATNYDDPRVLTQDEVSVPGCP